MTEKLIAALRYIAEANPEDVPQWELRDAAEEAIAAYPGETTDQIDGACSRIDMVWMNMVQKRPGDPAAALLKEAVWTIRKYSGLEQMYTTTEPV